MHVQVYVCLTMHSGCDYLLCVCVCARVCATEIVCVTVCKQPPSMGATVYVCGCCDCGDGMCVIVSVQGSLWITVPSEKLCA